jgi:hypothetical protein
MHLCKNVALMKKDIFIPAIEKYFTGNKEPCPSFNP